MPVLRFRALLLLLTLLAWPVPGAAMTADPRFGELPPGAASTSEMSGVACEICLDHLVEAAALPGRMPRGFRAITLAEAAEGDSVMQARLAQHPELAPLVIGSLCFLVADTFLVDGADALRGRRTPMAFWWVQASVADSGALDRRVRGSASYVQLASWYPRRGIDRERIRTTDPMAQFAEIRAERSGPYEWRLLLETPGGRITGHVRGDGVRVARRATGPGFMTVPCSGEEADAFTVYTYSGHHHQGATAEWQAHGPGALARGIERSLREFPMDTFYQDAWRARSGLYRRDR